MNYFNGFISWIEQNMVLVSSIVVPIIVAILGIFKLKQIQSNKIATNQKNNSIVGGSVRDSHNISANQSGAAGHIQVLGDGNIINNSPNITVEALKTLGLAYIDATLPNLKVALSTKNLNAMTFLENLDKHFGNLQISQDELNRFSEADVICWRHINLHGEYDFTVANDSVGMVFDLDRIKKLSIA